MSITVSCKKYSHQCSTYTISFEIVSHVELNKCLGVCYILPKLPSVYSCVSMQISSEVTWERSRVPHSNSCEECKLSVQQLTSDWHTELDFAFTWLCFIIQYFPSTCTHDFDVTNYGKPMMWNNSVCPPHLETAIFTACAVTIQT